MKKQNSALNDIYQIAYNVYSEAEYNKKLKIIKFLSDYGYSDDYKKTALFSKIPQDKKIEVVTKLKNIVNQNVIDAIIELNTDILNDIKIDDLRNIGKRDIASIKDNCLNKDVFYLDKISENELARTIEYVDRLTFIKNDDNYIDKNNNLMYGMYFMEVTNSCCLDFINKEALKKEMELLIDKRRKENKYIKISINLELIRKMNERKLENKQKIEQISEESRQRANIQKENIAKKKSASNKAVNTATKHKKENKINNETKIEIKTETKADIKNKKSKKKEEKKEVKFFFDRDTIEEQIEKYCSKYNFTYNYINEALFVTSKIDKWYFLFNFETGIVRLYHCNKFLNDDYHFQRKFEGKYSKLSNLIRYLHTHDHYILNEKYNYDRINKLFEKARKQGQIV